MRGGVVSVPRRTANATATAAHHIAIIRGRSLKSPSPTHQNPLMRLALCLFLTCLFLGSTTQAAKPNASDGLPNVLWIYLEDVSGWFSCYGDDLIVTPHIDDLARRGTRFDRFYTPAGVCSATRSAIVTGMMQTSIGAHQHRSCRPDRWSRGSD